MNNKSHTPKFRTAHLWFGLGSAGILVAVELGCDAPVADEDDDDDDDEMEGFFWMEDFAKLLSSS